MTLDKIQGETAPKLELSGPGAGEDPLAGGDSLVVDPVVDPAADDSAAGDRDPPAKKPRFEMFDEPEFVETAPPEPSVAESPSSLLDDDPDGFVAMLEAHADPERSWAEQIETLAVHDEFDFVGAAARPTLFAQWAAKHAPSYLDLVKQHSRPGLFYAHFKRQYGHLPGFKEYPDTKRETIYRDYMRFSKKTSQERDELRETYRGDELRSMVLNALD